MVSSESPISGENSNNDASGTSAAAMVDDDNGRMGECFICGDGEGESSSYYFIEVAGDVFICREPHTQETCPLRLQ